MFMALAGGVGGGKLAQGLATQLAPDRLMIVVNTGDDFVHLSMNISPDLDTVMYWLSGLNDFERGWGRAGETWNFMAALHEIGGPAWFNLGDKDLAIHVIRTEMLARRTSLSAVTLELCQRLGVRHKVIPMTDATLRTIVHTTDGPMPFQEYFVQRQCVPVVTGLTFEGSGDAKPAPDFLAGMTDEALRGIIICPSNPLLSIDPILSIGGAREWLLKRCVPAVAVSPIVGGQAIKGPAAKIFSELGRNVSVVGIAEHYRGLIDGLVIDTVDAALRPEIEALGIKVDVTPSVMRTAQDRATLAARVIDFASKIPAGSHA